MLNLSKLMSSNTLIISEGEYGVIEGENSLIASSKSNSGIILVLTDKNKKITSMAHINDEESIEENLDRIFADMTSMGADIKNLQCNLIGE